MRALDEQTMLEERLRRDAPPLRPADSTRVNAALQALAAAGTTLPLRASPPPFARPLARVAAGLVVAFGLTGALLLRTRPHSAASGAAAVPDVATFGDLAELMRGQDLAQALAGEAANLTDDLASLTDALNQSTLKILF